MAKEKKDKKIKTKVAVVDPNSTAPIETLPKVEKVVVQKIRGKDYREAKAKIDKTKAYPIKEAIELIKQSSYSKISGSLEIHLNLNQKGVSGDISLPYFQGKVKRVVIVDDKLIEELKAGKINFDVLLASATDMAKLIPFAKLLGPKGLMPNPKNGTLVPDPEKALKGYSTTALHYKTEKDFPLIHNVIGKLTQPDEELVANFKAFIKSVEPKKIKRIFIKSTMSPSVRVSL